MLAFLEPALILLSLGLLIAGLRKADSERKAFMSGQGNAEQRSPMESAYPTLPVVAPPPTAAPQTVEVPVVPTNPLDNAPLLRLLEEMSRFSADLGTDTEHFSERDRELSEFVLERILEMMERVPGVTRIAPEPGDTVVRGEHRSMDGAVSAGIVKRLLLPGVRVSERVVRPALVEIEL